MQNISAKILSRRTNLFFLNPLPHFLRTLLMNNNEKTCDWWLLFLLQIKNPFFALTSDRLKHLQTENSKKCFPQVLDRNKRANVGLVDQRCCISHLHIDVIKIFKQDSQCKINHWSAVNHKPPVNTLNSHTYVKWAFIHRRCAQNIKAPFRAIRINHSWTKLEKWTFLSFF